MAHPRSPDPPPLRRQLSLAKAQPTTWDLSDLSTSYIEWLIHGDHLFHATNLGIVFCKGQAQQPSLEDCLDMVQCPVFSVQYAGNRHTVPLGVRLR